MSSVQFSMRLTESDIRYFLENHGFKGCKVLGSYISSCSDEIILYFMFEGKQYVFIYSDFYLPSDFFSKEQQLGHAPFSIDDWLCFLKEKFDDEFVEYYALVFDAKQVIYDEPKFIQRISNDEFCSMIKRLINEVSSAIPFELNDDNIEITEVESFYKSERRFLIKDTKTKSFLFMRFSDYQVIVPRGMGDFFYRFMIGKFGREYIIEFEKHLLTMFEDSSFIDSYQSTVEAKVNKYIDNLNEE